MRSHKLRLGIAGAILLYSVGCGLSTPTPAPTPPSSLADHYLNCNLGKSVFTSEYLNSPDMPYRWVALIYQCENEENAKIYRKIGFVPVGSLGFPDDETIVFGNPEYYLLFTNLETGDEEVYYDEKMDGWNGNEAKVHPKDYPEIIRKIVGDTKRELIPEEELDYDLG